MPPGGLETASVPSCRRNQTVGLRRKAPVQLVGRSGEGQNTSSVGSLQVIWSGSRCPIKRSDYRAFGLCAQAGGLGRRIAIAQGAAKRLGPRGSS